MAIGEDRFGLREGAFLTKKLREAVVEDTTEPRRTEYWAGYAEGFLASLAARLPEVRHEMEQRLLYKDMKK